MAREMLLALLLLIQDSNCPIFVLEPTKLGNTPQVWLKNYLIVTRLWVLVYLVPRIKLQRQEMKSEYLVTSLKWRFRIQNSFHSDRWREIDEPIRELANLKGTKQLVHIDGKRQKTRLQIGCKNTKSIRGYGWQVVNEYPSEYNETENNLSNPRKEMAVSFLKTRQ